MKTLSAAEVAAKHNATLPKNHNQSAQLKGYVDRFTTLATEMDSIRQDTKELAAEAKDNGFDPVAIKAIVKEQMEDDEKKAKRQAKAAVVDTYRVALGLVD